MFFFQFSSVYVAQTWNSFEEAVSYQVFIISKQLIPSLIKFETSSDIFKSAFYVEFQTWKWGRKIEKQVVTHLGKWLSRLPWCFPFQCKGCIDLKQLKSS